MSEIKVNLSRENGGGGRPLGVIVHPEKGTCVVVLCYDNRVREIPIGEINPNA